MEEQRPTLTPSQARWQILREALISRKQSCQQQQQRSLSVHSVRRFTGYHLFNVRDDHVMHQQTSTDDAEFRWLCYSYSSSVVQLSNVKISILTEKAPQLHELAGFNNTGNVCLWPSEEVMALFCLENLDMFTGATVCELGAGMAGLAGVFLACSHRPRQVLLTDGNTKSVDNLKRIVTENLSNFNTTAVSAEILLWDPQTLATLPSSITIGSYDHILCADCLFFKDLHVSLAQIIKKLLRPDGTCHIFAPRRGGTLELFCSRAEEWFSIELVEKYSECVWYKHEECLSKLEPTNLYDPDIHYPVYLKMKPK